MQLVEVVLPVDVRYWPAAHGVQVVVPVATAYWPALHGRQLADSAAPVAPR
jgi:hypothetical protein